MRSRMPSQRTPWGCAVLSKAGLTSPRARQKRWPPRPLGVRTRDLSRRRLSGVRLLLRILRASCSGGGFHA